MQVNSDAEQQQAKAIIDAAAMQGAQHFVYSSGDRDGDERPPNNPIYVKKFAAKHAIEKHLQQRVQKSPQQMTYTILGPRLDHHTPFAPSPNLSNELQSL